MDEHKKALAEMRLAEQEKLSQKEKEITKANQELTSLKS